MVLAEHGGGMTTRRELLFAALVSFCTPLALGLPEKTKPLEVTYYYLPG
jgi:hypothetical protein